MRSVYFVDTSILCCLLQIPNFCEDHYHIVEEEFDRIGKSNGTMLLPVASILETGNHIAHVGDGNLRRKIAQEFSQYLRDTVNNKAPWTLIESDLSWTADDLRKYADEFPDHAMREMGLGDASIIQAFEKYIHRIRGISVKIWSLDPHLSAYSYEAPNIGRRTRG